VRMTTERIQHKHGTRTNGYEQQRLKHHKKSGSSPHRHLTIID
jgi:hypothetical protein